MKKDDNWLPSEKDIENYQLLKDMLQAQRQEFDLLSKKKADGQLNPMKIKMVNRVLEPLNKLFKHEPSHDFLDKISEDEIPTNSDVVLIISQYETAIEEFKKKYHRKDGHKSSYLNNVYRWMTKEYPPDFYEGEDVESEYEEDDEDTEIPE